MRKIVLFFSSIITISLLLFVSSSAQDALNVSLDSVVLSENNDSVIVSVTMSEAFRSNNKEIFLFCLPPGNDGNIDSLIPVAKTEVDDPQVQLSIPFDKDDLSAVLNGYLIAIFDGSKYLQISNPVYISNISQLAPFTYDYPSVNSKKGLQVQLTADAQLLGIKHTVINAFLNDLITDNIENTVRFVYGGKEYGIDQTTLNMLDYRVKTLSDAGIHIYMNILLAFDPSAPESLYYSNAMGNAATTMYAINVSNPENIKRIAAVIHFLTNRYTQNTRIYGFCGSYIVGYEVNNEAENNSAGITGLDEYVYSYAVLLRAADAAARSAYKNARVYVSISNQWNISVERSKSARFGAYEFLAGLSEICRDVPFGISVNPYPSDLEKNDFWNDDKAQSQIDTEYLTLKNLEVFTDYMKTDAMLFDNAPRHALIGEFGVSGKHGEETEQLQAAAYAYAYYCACTNDLIEAFIWHRHVDHPGESGLYYGLYSAGELLLDPKSQKQIYSVMASIDTLVQDNSFSSDFDKLLEFLPASFREDLLAVISDSEFINRKLYNASAVSFQPNRLIWDSAYLFDFSESVYTFYPSDNSQYLEQYVENGERFMRICLLPITPVEYMGAGCSIFDLSLLSDVSYLGVRIRVNSKTNTADFKLLITHGNESVETVLDCSATVISGEWTDLLFPIDADCFNDTTGSGKMKIWVKGTGESENDYFLDIQSIKLYSTDESTVTRSIFLVLLASAASAVIILSVIFLLLKRGKNKHNQ